MPCQNGINTQQLCIYTSLWYMPTSKTADEEVEEVYAGIDELMKHTKLYDKAIIMKDFNAKIGDGKEGREVGDFGFDKRNARGERVV